MLKLGWAAGCVLGEHYVRGLSRNDSKDKRGKILIGKDTRISGYLLESVLEAGLSAAGVNISLLGPMPTPGIAYLTRASGAAAGIVISASHNPYHDNGIKFFSPEGNKLPDEVELEIERKMADPMQIVDSAALGKAERFSDAAGRYIEFCKYVISRNVSLQDLKIVVDCANGAAYHIAPSVLAELGADVIATANKPDGFNINEECGATDVRHLTRLVTQHQADLGIALDGDGDRLIMVDEHGETVDGDQILYILARSEKRKGRLDGGVAGTLMSNLGLERALAVEGIPFQRAKVGDRYVLSLLREQGWILGGEASGHIICLDKCTTGDGIVAALQVLQAMCEAQMSLHEIKQGMQIYPQTLINVRLPAGNTVRSFDLAKSDALRSAVKRAESELGDNGRVLLRPSGTEPVIRVMVEGMDEQQVSRIGEDLADQVRATSI